MTDNVLPLPPRVWFPTPEDRAAIRTYCAEAYGNRPNAILIAPGWRYNTEDARIRSSLNLRRVTSDPDWNDTDLTRVGEWDDLDAVPLDRKGRALVDFYIYAREFKGERGDLIGNAQAYVEPVDGKLTLIGFSATGRDFSPAK